MKLRLIFAGSRDATREECKKAWADFPYKDDVIEFISGQASGADSFEEEIADELGIHVESFPVEWGDLSVPGAIPKYNRFGKLYNRVAGLQRNERMAQYVSSSPDCQGALLYVWKNNSPGTRHMIEMARKYNLLIYPEVKLP